MNVINKCLDEIIFSIPPEVLRTVFQNTQNGWRQNPPKIEENIMALVIRPRVLIDLNLLGGTEAFIDLANCPSERTDDYTTIYRIPKNRTQGRSITSVLNVTFSDPTKISSYGVAAGQQNTMMLQAASGMMDSMGSIPMTSTARVQLIGENVVMVRDTVLLPANIYLRCILANDENLSHVQIRSYRYIAKLCVLAVKAFIYNSYIVKLDMGQLVGGQELGKIKDIVDGYADSEELYQTFLTETIEKVMLMNDQEGWNRMLKLVISGNR